MQCGSRLWFPGKTWPDGTQEEWPEDMRFPLQNLPPKMPNQEHAYTLEDIDDYSAHLGIPWQLPKDLPFATANAYLGFLWDLDVRTVTLTQKKKEKYLAALDEWLGRRTHTLRELEQLYGKLLHASLVIPQGRAYVMGLEAMFPIFGHEPHKPWTPPHTMQHDLRWWVTHLASFPPCLIPICEEISDVKAFSDASNASLAITIGSHWRAWTLDPSWRADGRDIAWAEAVAFEFLIKAVARRFPDTKHFRLFGDNRGVVKGWRRGRSRNTFVNQVFRRIHELE
jgi:hypothetical protein